MSDSFTIQIPCTFNSTSASYAFTLTPALPADVGITTWPTKGYVNGIPIAVDSFSLEFETANVAAGVPKILESQQYAVLIFTIDSSVASDWEFFGNGTEILSSGGNCQYNVLTEVLDPKNLKIEISQVAPTTYSFGDQPDQNLDTVIKVTPADNGDNEYLAVNFRYVLKYLPTGEIYMSQDPRVGSRR